MLSKDFVTEFIVWWNEAGRQFYGKNAAIRCPHRACNKLVSQQDDGLRSLAIMARSASRVDEYMLTMAEEELAEAVDKKDEMFWHFVRGKRASPVPPELARRVENMRVVVTWLRDKLARTNEN